MNKKKKKIKVNVNSQPISNRSVRDEVAQETIFSKIKRKIKEFIPFTIDDYIKMVATVCATILLLLFIYAMTSVNPYTVLAEETPTASNLTLNNEIVEVLENEADNGITEEETTNLPETINNSDISADYTIRIEHILILCTLFLMIIILIK